MSEYDLIPEDAYANLPQDPNDKFAVLVRVAQTNLARLLDQSGSSDFSTEIRSQFISIIGGIAEALGIEGLPQIGNDLAAYDKYQMFQVYLAGVVAKVRLQGQLVARPFSVELGRISKAKIQQEIDQLRQSIDGSDLSDKKKSALSDKLDDLQTELEKQRLSFARDGDCSINHDDCRGGAAALANAPGAAETVITIIRIVGEDKDKEEQERLRLMPPPMALLDYTSSLAQGKPSAFDMAFDDVPF